MSTNDYVPHSDADFHVWQAALVAIVQPSVVAWGILAGDVTALVAQQTPWTGAYNKASNKQNRTAADVQAKDDARKAYEKGIRLFVGQWLSKNPKVPNSERERMGLTVKSTTHTAVPAPSSKPVGSVDFSQLLRHTLSFVDENAKGSKAKPAGVHGCEIFSKLGDAADFSYLGTSTSSPYLVQFTDADAGKTASYRIRWVNTRGEQGPWSNPFSAPVVG